MDFYFVSEVDNMVVTGREREGLWSLLESLGEWDYDTLIHSHNTERVASHTGRLLNLSGEEQEKLYYGSLLHDIGKLAVPIEILTKRSALTRDEFGVIQMHPSDGVRICQNIVQDRDVLSMIGLHHINENGTGYGDKDIELEYTQLVRIVHIADVVSALFEERVYKKSMEELDVIQLLNDDNHLFDSQLKDIVIHGIHSFRCLVVSSI